MTHPTKDKLRPTLNTLTDVLSDVRQTMKDDYKILSPHEYDQYFQIESSIERTIQFIRFEYIEELENNS